VVGSSPAGKFCTLRLRAAIGNRSRLVTDWHYPTSCAPFLLFFCRRGCTPKRACASLHPSFLLRRWYYAGDPLAAT
jgi:hypothetical protein